MRGFANIMFFLALVSWTAAFFTGPGNEMIWKVGGYSLFMAGLGVFLHLLAIVFPGSAPVHRPVRKSDLRKCRTCGRPAIPGSDLCKYHTDEMRALDGGGMR